MIVYNVQRRFFELKGDAERHRVSQGLKPAAIIKLEIGDRADLAALLNALCEPGADPVAEANLPVTDPKALIDRAFVPAGRSVPDCVPAFLVRDMEARGYKL